MFVRDPGFTNGCVAPTRTPDAVQNARIRRFLCERLEHCTGNKVSLDDISVLVESSGKTLVGLDELDDTALVGAYLELKSPIVKGE